MTDKEKKSFGVIRNCSAGLSSFRMEGERCPRGMKIRFAGIIGVREFSENSIEIINHGGRISVKGSRLLITVFENNQVEINGKIEAVGFAYGKN